MGRTRANWRAGAPRLRRGEKDSRSATALRPSSSSSAADLDDHPALHPALQDLRPEGRQVGADTLDYIHVHKTGALIRASLRVGAMLCGATAEQVRALSIAGADLGLAFQIVDDILDVVGSSAELGKTAGKDQIQQKATYPAIHGIEASRARARDLVGEADAALAALGPRAEPIRALGRFFLERKA